MGTDLSLLAEFGGGGGGGPRSRITLYGVHTARWAKRKRRTLRPRLHKRERVARQRRKR